MAIIKQIAVYDLNYNQNNHWKIDDIGVNNASNVELGGNTTIRNQSNVLDSLLALDGDLGTIETNFNDKVDKSGDTVSGVLNFTQHAKLTFIDDELNENENARIFHYKDVNGSGIVIDGAQRSNNILRTNTLSIGINNQGEPNVDISGLGLNETNITVEGAWRNAIKAFGKYGDEEHYGSMFIQPTPNDPDVTADLSQGVTDRNWSGIAFRDKNNQEMSLVRSYSRAKTSSVNSITGFQIDSRYRNWGSSNALIGRNILEIGVDEIGNPIVNIQAVGATAADNKTSYAQAAWRSAIGIPNSANSTTAGLLSPALYTKISNNVVTHLGILNKQFNFTVTSSSTLDNIDISYNGNNPYNLLYIPIGIIGVRHTEPTISIDQYYISSDNETLMYRVTNSSNSQISATATFTILYINYNNQTLSS